VVCRRPFASAKRNSPTGYQRRSGCFIFRLW
jgi:hypothetical protein